MRDGDFDKDDSDGALQTITLMQIEQHLQEIKERQSGTGFPPPRSYGRLGPKAESDPVKIILWFLVLGGAVYYFILRPLGL